MKYIINGCNKLRGTIRISGNKNSVFPCIAAALLTEDEVILDNISSLSDTEVLIEILHKLGVTVVKKGSTVRIKASNIRHFTLPEDLMLKLRGSIVLVGALLGRLGKVNFYFPGGDIIGRRSIDTHIDGFKALGAELKKSTTKFSLHISQDSKKDRVDIFFPEASVTATENLVLASVLGQREVTLRNCAKEPHIVDLCKILTSMGASIEGIGTDTLEIKGVSRLNGTKFKIGADYIEAGTYIVAAAVTGGEVRIEGMEGTSMEPILVPLKGFGINIEKDNDAILVHPSRLKSKDKLVTNIWPGFPTDFMSVAIVLATQSKGVVLCHDWMYEVRMFFIDKLISMGAKIILADPYQVLVYGPDRLHGKTLATPDIRAGMALVVAALVAKGESVINQAQLIERGYEDVVGKLRSLGADIRKVEA